MSKKESKIESGKNRVYTGQIVCSANYNSFTPEMRNFWNKAHRAFMKGYMYFMHNNLQHIVPFKFADGTFDTVVVAEKFNKKVENVKKQKEEELTHKVTDKC